MNFTATNPVVNSFTATCIGANKWGPITLANTICTDQGAILDSTLAWNVSGADRYEIWNGEYMWYSGTSTSYVPPAYPGVGGPNLTLKAFNGGNVTSITISPTWEERYFCGANCTGS